MEVKSDIFTSKKAIATKNIRDINRRLKDNTTVPIYKKEYANGVIKRIYGLCAGIKERTKNCRMGYHKFKKYLTVPNTDDVKRPHI